MKKLIPLLLPLLALAFNVKAQDTLENIPKGIATIRFTKEVYANLSIDTLNGRITTSNHRVDSLFSIFQVSGIKKLFPVKNESKLITGIYRSYLINFPSTFIVNDVLSVLNSFPDVIEYAVPDYLNYPDVCPDDPKYANNNCNIKQWNLEKINMPAAWDIEKGCPDIRIAVLEQKLEALIK